LNEDAGGDEKSSFVWHLMSPSNQTNFELIRPDESPLTSRTFQVFGNG